METQPFGIRGFLIDAPEFGVLRSQPNGGIVVEDGRIAASGEYNLLRRTHHQCTRWIDHKGAAIFPGLIDCHTHLPQYPAVARGESHLLPWLRNYIFPVERNFTPAGARAGAPAFFRELARHGTTTGMIYTAIYEDSCDVAFEAARNSGLRVIMGKMMMDVDSYGQLQPNKIASISLGESERLCQKWHGADNGRLEYAFSPRFAVTCSEELMRGAAGLAKRFDAYVQTHLSENREEIEQVRRLFTWASDYTHVYEQCGLLTPKTVLGHCIHLNRREIEAIATAESRVAHCPTSNFFLGSGLMKLDKLMKADIAVGLGSDVAGGPEVNMWQVMRAAIEVQQARAAYETSVPPLRASEAFYLATQGGARALRKEEIIGTLDPGKEADVIVVDLAALLPYHDSVTVMPELSSEDALTLCIYRGGPGATLETYVRGKCVYRARKLGGM
jgi:guanine deaminase